MKSDALPPLTDKEQSYVSVLCDVITQRISENNGMISFHDFMNMALYTPGLGYYATARYNIGEKGDFITAPTFSKLFSQTFAQHFANLLTTLGNDAVIVEFGAGTGQFACDCLLHLKQLNRLPKAYYIIETSADLAHQQRQLLQEALPDYYANIHWLAQLPTEKLNAVVFANEVLDAMPVELFSYESNHFFQTMVACSQDGFTFTKNASLPESLHEVLEKLPIKNRQNDMPYNSEVNLWIRPWLQSICRFLAKGVVYICDYGYHRDLYYSPERMMGTLSCYYKHHVHYNPLINVGVQDITAHVDFTEVAEAAEQLGFEIDGFVSQGKFLLAAGIMERYQALVSQRDNKETLALSQQLQKLTLATEFSESFKVMAISLNYDDIIEPFEQFDQSYLL
ncbi:class I SAM-dependent methyltransferase [Facilibium subflavum]|uniref:class I SAM-dependent methyltransferase n=1 Tax=Facilibium subflavum TaxID=2219058 RepID=UPI000E64AC41|nr:SAM-dependent methyltransferase [Facilibium subflavum]